MTFLRVETELAATFFDMVQRTRNQEHREQLMGDIRKIVDALRHFKVQIADDSVRADIIERADGLTKFLATNSK